jgi:hypothetical protein
MEYVRTHVDGSRTRVYTEKSQTSGNVAATDVVVSNVAELEAAVAAQIADQFIYVAPGQYDLTEELVPLIAATGGGLIGLGNVEINGHDDADSAISIVATGATGTFQYTLGGIMSFKGGTDKIGLHLTNPAISQKTILYIRDEVHFEDNGSGKAFVAANTGTGAMRVYCSCTQGTGWDSVDITNKNVDDKWRFRGINFDETFDVAVVAIADNWLFQGCQLVHAGMAGGHASNVVNVVNCFTIETADVAAVDSGDFPGAFSATIV